VAVRAMAPVAGMPPKKGVMMLPTPNASSSASGSWRVRAIPSATTAERSDSMAPSMATAKALGSSMRTVARLRPMGWPLGVSAPHGHMKEGSTRGIPATRWPSTIVWNRLPIVSTWNPGTQRRRSQLTIAANGSAMSGGGILRARRGRRVNQRFGNRGESRMAMVPSPMATSQDEAV